MHKKVLLLIFIFIFFINSFLSKVWASDTILKGHAIETKENEQQRELFTGVTDKNGKNKLLIMNVSQVLDADSSKEGDEFFAEVINNVEGRNGILIPSETVAHGRIKQVSSAKRLGRNGYLDLEFDYLVTPDGREIPIKGKMSTKLYPVAEISKIIATDIGYTAAGSTVGGLLGLAWFGLSNAAASQGATVAGGAAIGGTIGLGMALYRKGKDVLISPGDEIRVCINTSEPLPVYKKNAFLQHEFYPKGLDVKINDIVYEKDAFNEVHNIKLRLSISNNTSLNFSVFNLALLNNYNTFYYPAIFGDEKNSFKTIKPGDNLTGELTFSVDNVKQKFWLTFYNEEKKKIIAKISLNNAYSLISDKSKRQNEKISKKKKDFYKEIVPYY